MELGRGPGLFSGRRLVRGLAVLVFAVGLEQSAARVVGTRFEPVLLIPAGLAVLVGWLTSRVPFIVRLVVQAVAFVGAGMAVAYASDGTASDFGHGLLDGPRQLVTTSWPSPRFPTIFVALGAVIFLAAAVSTDLAMRMRWRALAIAPMVIAMVGIISVGAPDGPQWQAVVFAASAAFVLLWIGLDDRVPSVRAGALVAVGAALAALLTTLGVSEAVAARANPRRGESANRELSLIDPLAEVTAQSAANPARDLYEIDAPDLPRLHLWRLTALDVYNGESWSTSGQLAPIGNRLDPGTSVGDVVATVTALHADTDLWLSPGLLLRSSAPVEADAGRRVVRIIGTQRPAVTTFTAEPLQTFSPDPAETLATIQPTDIESSYSQLATSRAGSGTIAQQIATLVATLHDEYQLNPNNAGGVQQNRVDDFLRNSKIGTMDQFVTGFVLMARSLGVDARVATGYNVDATGTSVTVTSADAVAWAEVRTTRGWEAVDVVPEHAVPAVNDESSSSRPQTPAAASPVEAPPLNEANPDEPPKPTTVAPTDTTWAEVRVWALRGGLFTGLLLWPFAVFAVVVTWRKLRRRKGLKSADPARRVTTAWTLATDALIDAGATLLPSHTNAELVAVGVETEPTTGPPLGRLQRHADAVTFTSALCEPDRAADAVEQLRLVEAGIRNSSTRWWRWRWWLSTRSLRSRTQSPLR